MAIVQGNAFVLRTRDFAESDLIVTLLTDKWGKRAGIIKGARRPKSRLGGIFDLLNQLEVVFYQKSGLDLISKGSLIDSFQQLKASTISVSKALSSCRLVDRLLPESQPEQAVYTLFARFLKLFNQDTVPVEQLQLAFTLKLVAILGHRPQLTCCARCGGEPRQLVFATDQGTVLCQQCSTGQGVLLTRGLSMSLDSLLRYPMYRAGIMQINRQDLDLASGIIDNYTEQLIAGVGTP